MLSYTRDTVYIFYTLAGARHSWLADPSIEVQGLLRHATSLNQVGNVKCQPTLCVLLIANVCDPK